MKRSLSYMLFSLWSMAACEFHQENLPEDREYAMKQARSFYAMIKEEKFEELSKSFGGHTSQDTGLSQLLHADSVLGDLKNYEIINVRTEVVKTSGGILGKYQIKLSCKYSAGDTKETLNYIKNNNYLYLDGRSVTVVTK